MSLYIKNSSFQKIYDPYEIVAEFGTESVENFTIHNSGNNNLLDVVLYFEKSETMGDVDNPATFEPYVDFSHIIKMGNAKFANSNSVGSLVVHFDGNDYLIHKDSGSSRLNGINLGNFAADERKAIEVKLNTPSNYSSRRMFVNMVVK